MKCFNFTGYSFIKNRKTRFRPCIDLHEGKVKQIVGGTLDHGELELETNFETDRPAAWFAEKYRNDELTGGHVIRLGQGNDDAARSALAAYPDGMQIGGGIQRTNAVKWLEAGASHVILTSHLFDHSGRFLEKNLDGILEEVGPDRLVIDLSCRRSGEGWVVAMNRWQTPTELEVNVQTLDFLGDQCAEFLIHAADVEGKCQGIDHELVKFLGGWRKIPITYAGGASSLEDLETVNRLSSGTVDLTIGSALDIFGGGLIRYVDCVAYNRRA